jgi:hypothetical protein
MCECVKCARGGMWLGIIRNNEEGRRYIFITLLEKERCAARGFCTLCVGERRREVRGGWISY